MKILNQLNARLDFYKFIGALILIIQTFSLKAAYLPIQYANVSYESSIKTVILSQAQSYERFPAIDLNSRQQLNLQFDNMFPESENLQYTFIHCSSDWKPSNLRPNEYLTGNMFENINDYSFSNNTFQVYTHYNVVFPSADMKPKLSGNYIIKVYREFDENDIVLTRRFMVVEDKYIITPSPKIATDPRWRFTSQEIDFSVNTGDNTVANPLMDVKATIMQNLRWDNAIFDLKPRFVNGKVLDYNYESGNVFLGGNEFRYFDIRNLRFLSYNVQRKYLEGRLKHAVLYRDATRVSQTYLQTIDFNGKMVVDNRDNAVKGEIESDYAMVHFSYVSDKIDKDVYIFGELTDWQIKEDFKMEWNEKSQEYQKEMLLKQAYYNYFYVTADDKKAADLENTEKNFSNTENDYHILIYNKNQFMQYDELLATVGCNSMKK
ncbi:MAG: DUF5103 domain-containing protein [Bacteroidia bacterium]|nr:DUF5103 domain-containing protein [Bacteroidia bacterium]